MSPSKRKVHRLNSVEGAIPGEVQSVNREFIDINEAATHYGCQINHIWNFIARDMLHPFFDKQEVEKLKQKHLCKQINDRLNQQKEKKFGLKKSM